MTEAIATFDIDGTLIKRKNPNLSTAKIDAINNSINKVFSIDSIYYLDLMSPEMYGMTDRSILRKILFKIGIDKSVIDHKFDILFEEILKYFFQHRKEICDDYIILPGIVQLLDALEKRGVKLGLATGNLSEFAYWKLTGVKLGHYFKFGGFGEDNEDRSGIISAALKRANNCSNTKACHFGDTPFDIEAAKSNNILSAAISSQGGGTFDSKTLADTGADLVVNSWGEIDRILELFHK
ncbi:MAG: HAD family hydrolase [candidate division Zixibacteria bacterium]|nr:HAD family hydrolase [candidate division Zixibacteria bacterium]